MTADQRGATTIYDYYHMCVSSRACRLAGGRWLAGWLAGGWASGLVCGCWRARGLPAFAGGKTMGGRMTSLAAAHGDLPAAVSGIVFFGFPLHPVGKAGAERAEHLREVGLPMLFLQGSRDKLAELSRIKPVCRSLGRRASLHVVDGADHGFHVLVRSGRNDDEVRFELADAARRFIVEQSP